MAEDYEDKARRIILRLRGDTGMAISAESSDHF